MPADIFKKTVIDASFLLAALVPDETTLLTRGFLDRLVAGEVRVFSSGLLSLEVGNGLVMAARRKRVNWDQAEDLYKQFLALKIEMIEVNYRRCFDLAKDLELTFYDASYKFVANALDLPLLSLDKRLATR